MFSNIHWFGNCITQWVSLNFLSNLDRDDNLPQHICDDLKLYIGSIYSLTDENLTQFGITHIVSCVHWLQQPYHPPEIPVHYVSVWDTTTAPIGQHFPQAVAFIENSIKEGGTVLVHCHAGRSRSATIVIAYLMAKYGIEFEEVLAYLQKRRSVINPNDGFVEQLREWQQVLTLARRADPTEIKDINSSIINPSSHQEA